jgi:hypothetical protein
VPQSFLAILIYQFPSHRIQLRLAPHISAAHSAFSRDSPVDLFDIPLSLISDLLLLAPLRAKPAARRASFPYFLQDPQKQFQFSLVNNTR